MKKSKLKPVEVTFWDHCRQTGDFAGLEPLQCIVMGYMAKETDLAYYILSWMVDQDATNDNNEWYVVLKSTVTNFKELS
jgi:hypothetical protein